VFRSNLGISFSTDSEELSDECLIIRPDISVRYEFWNS